MHQEDHLGEHDKGDLFEERGPQRVHRLRDQRGAVVERNDAHAGRQARADLRDTPLDRVDHLLCVGAAAHHDHAADRLVASLDQRRDPERVTHMNLAELVHIDGNA